MNSRAGEVRVERVANIDRNLELDRRGHRARVDDLRAEVRHLHRFLVAQLAPGARRPGTWRGLALITPSTSVQMWIASASSIAPKIEAEKSLPFRPSVVGMPSGVLAMKPVMITYSASREASQSSSAARNAPGRPPARAPRTHRQHVSGVDPVDRLALSSEVRGE